MEFSNSTAPTVTTTRTTDRSAGSARGPASYNRPSSVDRQYLGKSKMKGENGYSSMPCLSQHDV